MIPKGVTMDLQELTRRYFAALERGVVGDELAALYDPEVVQEEFPEPADAERTRRLAGIPPRRGQGDRRSLLRDPRGRRGRRPCSGPDSCGPAPLRAHGDARRRHRSPGGGCASFLEFRTAESSPNGATTVLTRGEVQPRARIIARTSGKQRHHCRCSRWRRVRHSCSLGIGPEPFSLTAPLNNHIQLMKTIFVMLSHSCRTISSAVRYGSSRLFTDKRSTKPGKSLGIAFQKDICRPSWTT